MFFAALKSTDSKYIINGDYSVSENGPYEAAGSIFDYFRVDSSNTSKIQKRSDGVTEWITSPGPTYEPVHLMVSKL